MSVRESAETAPKYKLRIVFDGVIAVGPPEPEQGGTHPGPIYGVMAASTRRKSTYSERNNDNPVRYIPMHVPTIYTTMTPVEGSRASDESFQISDDHPQWNIWHPLRERLEFRFDGKADVEDITFNKNSSASFGLYGGRIPAGTLNIASINHVPNASSIWGKRSILKSGLLSDAKGVASEAAAQILVPKGDLCAGGLFEKGKPVDVKFDPPHDTGGRTHSVLPNVVVFVEAHRLEIASYSMDTGEQLDSLKFDLTEDSEIWVSNGDPTDTDIHLKQLSQQAVETDKEKISDAHVNGLQKILPIGLDPAVLKKLVSHYMGGDNPVIRMDPKRVSDVDLDFELFGELFEGSDPEPYPIAKRPNGVFFGGPNCMNNRARCHKDDRDKLVFKSNQPLP